MKPRRVIVRLSALFLCLMWGIGALTKIRAPLVAYELVALNIGPGDAAKFLLSVVVGIEALLAIWLALGLSAVRGLWGSLAWLGALTIGLVIANGRVGGAVPCGCFPSFLDSDVEGALIRNGVLMATIALLLAWEHAARFRARGAPVDERPATP